MEQNPSSEANSHSASQEIPRLVWDHKSSLPFSHEPATAPYPEPDESNLHPQPLLLVWSTLYYPSISA